eukprot:9480219-Pyramimonas_sp.AAC.1
MVYTFALAHVSLMRERVPRGSRVAPIKSQPAATLHSFHSFTSLAPRFKHHVLVHDTQLATLLQTERCPSFMAGLKTPTLCGGLSAEGARQSPSLRPTTSDVWRNRGDHIRKRDDQVCDRCQTLVCCKECLLETKLSKLRLPGKTFLVAKNIVHTRRSETGDELSQLL